MGTGTEECFARVALPRKARGSTNDTTTPSQPFDVFTTMIRAKREVAHTAVTQNLVRNISTVSARSSVSQIVGIWGVRGVQRFALRRED